MSTTREIMLYGFSAIIVIVMVKLAAPTIAKVPIIGQPVANIAAVI